MKYDHGAPSIPAPQPAVKTLPNSLIKLAKKKLPPPRQRNGAQHLLSRETGHIAFNQRVLAQAQDSHVPLLERLRYLCIVSSNLDEFFETRVAELKERIKLGDEVARPGEETSAVTFAAVTSQTHAIVNEQYRVLNHEILPALAEEGVRFLG